MYSTEIDGKKYCDNCLTAELLGQEVVELPEEMQDQVISAINKTE